MLVGFLTNRSALHSGHILVQDSQKTLRVHDYMYTSRHFLVYTLWKIRLSAFR